MYLTCIQPIQYASDTGSPLLKYPCFLDDVHIWARVLNRAVTNIRHGNNSMLILVSLIKCVIHKVQPSIPSDVMIFHTYSLIHNFLLVSHRC